MRSSTEKYANLYLQQGWSVIPVQTSGKIPLIEWKEFTTRHPTPQEITEWFTKRPDCNIGIVTGPISNLAVVDEDGAEGMGEANRLGIYSPITSLTGKGKQAFFQYPKGGIWNSVKKWPGIDIRGENGFVVAPPSLHPSGKRYCWAGSPIVLGLLPPLPDVFVEKKAQLPGLRKQNESGWEAEALKELRNGHVHNTLVRVLGKFRQHNFSEEGTYQFLLPHALENGKPYEGLRGKIAEIWARYAAGPSSTTLSKSEDIDMFLSDVKEVEWLCKPYIARNSIGFVAGLPETLKTWLCIDLAVESARENGLWLGLFPVTSSKVLFIDQERSRDETQNRFNRVLAGKNLQKKDLQGRLYVKSGTTIRLNLDPSYQAFRNEISELRPDIIIIDSFKSFHTSPENDATEIQKVVERLRILRNEFGCAFVFIHHENKSAYPNGEPQGEPHMGTLSGSIAIPAAAEMCIIVRKVEEFTSMVWHVKSTQGKKGKPIYASVQDVSEGIVVRGLSD